MLGPVPAVVCLVATEEEEDGEEAPLAVDDFAALDEKQKCAKKESATSETDTMQSKGYTMLNKEEKEQEILGD